MAKRPLCRFIGWSLGVAAVTAGFARAEDAKREIPLILEDSGVPERDAGDAESAAVQPLEQPVASGLMSQQYALEMLGIYDIWESETGAGDVVVAVIDSGVDFNHRDLSGRAWVNPRETLNGQDDDGNGLIDDIQGWDYIDDDNAPQDEAGHGTHIAGIIAARGRFSGGVAGVADVRLMSLRVLDAERRGLDSDVIAAIHYAVANGADVINISLGGMEPNAALAAACMAAENAGVVVVAAVGNQGQGATLYPAAYRSVLGVAAVDEVDGAPEFNNWGTSVDLAAPGVRILSTVLDGRYGFRSGTSMATAYVAGIAALLRSSYPGATPAEIRAALIQSAVDVNATGWDVKTGYGRVDGYAALRLLPDVDASAERLTGSDSVLGSNTGSAAQQLPEAPAPCGFGVLPALAASFAGLGAMGRGARGGR